jgi:hypothetical protein
MNHVSLIKKSILLADGSADFTLGLPLFFLGFLIGMGCGD